MPELVLYNRARKALAEARSIDEVKDIHDKMRAYEVYARQAKDTEMLEAATDIKLRAARRAGEILHAMQVSGEREGRGGDRRSKSAGASLKLENLDVSKDQSSRWQKLSAMAAEDFEKRVASIKRQTVRSVEMTSAERTADKQQRRAEHEANLAHQIRGLPTKKFGLVLADPEWRFIPWNEETGNDRAAANHYATSPLEKIKARDVPSIAFDDCVLAMWATVPMLEQALEVMSHWSFQYKTHFVWLKDKIGTGYWSRNIHEILLIGTKGNPPAPAMGTQYESAWDAPVGAHSEKPDFAYELLEAYFPNLPRIELNARKRRDGWEHWGAEAPLDMDAAE